ncbi:MAG TPA: sulfatase-like hydrolase/transferase [Rhizomicrobium sp.]|jgi:arylsulfatase A-like enzyme|nr:sulfatase-like hydrolase/transferase [Rhizomicrobium sp.]
MGRKILFITTDQQRFDSLGCNGNKFCRTPHIDALANAGINYTRAYNQNTVCMPARSTMLTGQYVRTHGVFANGVPLPENAPSVAQYLKDKAGYKTALIGKAHFEPAFDLKGRWRENRRQMEGDFGPWRGFDYAIHAMHIANFRGQPVGHYGRWVQQNYPDYFNAVVPLLDAKPGGDTGAPETANNPLPREAYHTDWLARLAVDWLKKLESDDDWFLWLSFPDPHHPWDPPASENKRCDWHDLPLPDGHPGSPDAIRKVLAKKPAHWLAFYEGRFANIEGGPMNFTPQQLSDDNIREINAKVHVENELIDEAIGSVMAQIRARGWDADTDVIFTTDHGELQGDFGFVYKGPWHVDALMRLPFIWRPAPSEKTPSAVVQQPVEQVDLAPTFAAIAGVEPASWMQGKALPTSEDGSRQRALCEWDSQFPGYGMHLRSIYRDGFVLTRYEPSTGGQPNGLEKHWPQFAAAATTIQYDGTEGELYDLNNDPRQWENLWDDPKRQSLKSDLIADLYDSLPPERATKLEVEAPA